MLSRMGFVQSVVEEGPRLDARIDHEMRNIVRGELDGVSNYAISPIHFSLKPLLVSSVEMQILIRQLVRRHTTSHSDNIVVECG